MILAAAENVFAEHGYDRARLEDVAQAVGIRRASLLYHFRDKPTLYAAVLDSMLDDLFARYRRVLDVEGPTGARLEDTIDAWLHFSAERPALIRIMLRELADGVSEHSRPFADRALPIVTALADVIATGQAEGALRRTSALHVLMILGGATSFLTLGGAIYARNPTERFPVMVDREQHRELLLAIFRKLLGTGGPRPVADT
jgi:TetR/AcrR family transcriptional regulator